MNTNITWHQHHITKQDRAQHTSQKSCILWFTGLSGSGKSTIANALETMLYNNKNFTYLLDGDNIRHGLNKDLNFDRNSRTENIRRIGEVSKLFVESGLIILTAFISPFRDDREVVRDLVAPDEFIEIFIDTSLEICEQRDPKGLYKKARSGEIKNFTGINSAYEKPSSPEIHIVNDTISIEQACQHILSFLIKKNYITWEDSPCF
jgi:adenylylsulfate kinase